MAHGVLLVIQGCATLAMVSAWSASDAVIKLWPLESGNYERQLSVIGRKARAAQLSRQHA